MQGYFKEIMESFNMAESVSTLTGAYFYYYYYFPLPKRNHA
ncbi:hypothetical protein TREAZ_0054 [Leadbettera azotonutricia ZAS-9]|uniref:Uncharacterized protein n=1 Tax=Leadbettera azotonutricia (strain ATCC BAA-888 / DSM 13862 / ZAS-9) TaxID=545695 RepID=F5YFM3_LEAAZ|nr:hypothetical protein TREAZ_0054 [Leadbettera azotonutricia ZAS-9]